MNLIIDKIVSNAIIKFGLEDKKTVIIAENAEKLKEKYAENLVKLF